MVEILERWRKQIKKDFSKGSSADPITPWDHGPGRAEPGHTEPGHTEPGHAAPGVGRST